MYLIGQISLLQPQVGGDVLVDRPGEFVVQLPRDEAQQHRAERDHTGRGDQAGVQVGPGAGVDVARHEQLVDRLVHLVHLHRRVDHHAQVVHADTDHLNGVLQPQRVPDEHQLVYEAEDEDRKVGGDGQRSHSLRRRIRRARLPFQTGLELPEDIRLQPQAYDGLEQGDQGESPGPARAGQVHLAATLPRRARGAD